LIQDILDPGRSLTDCHWGDDEIYVALFENTAILIDQKSAYFLCIDNLLVKIFKAGAQEEIAKEDSSFHIDAKGLTSHSLDIVEKFSLFLALVS
jgi:hypothetical protein